MNLGLLKLCFQAKTPWRLKKKSSVNLELNRRTFVACLYSDCVTGWKISGVERIMLHSVCVRCCQYWTSLTSVAQKVYCGCPRRQEYKGFKSGEQAGHAVCPSLPIRCFWYTLFKNCRKWRSKCGWIPVCRFAS